jgi:hypothetical protein
MVAWTSAIVGSKHCNKEDKRIAKVAKGKGKGKGKVKGNGKGKGNGIGKGGGTLCRLGSLLTAIVFKVATVL